MQIDGGWGHASYLCSMLTNPKFLSSFFSYPCALSCPFLQFLALTENSIVLFSIACALFDKNAGVGTCTLGEASSSASVSDPVTNRQHPRLGPFPPLRDSPRSP